jgi:hypothetical protein
MLSKMTPARLMARRDAIDGSIEIPSAAALFRRD